MDIKYGGRGGSVFDIDVHRQLSKLNDRIINGRPEPGKLVLDLSTAEVEPKETAPLAMEKTDWTNADAARQS